ncbi:flagellar filament capping protein FliD [Maridesulfovibrio bastinii]|uniref:flagellar filament capping protein FliD n=1 Tax=Maridesulfovibrio bastinii TaxID=47157 RepID=UPI0004261DA2|nr:flagellar filament capping protein FliD [Maridesulfovibrio bastinii]
MAVSSLSSDVLSYSSNTSSGSITFSGLGNGTDFDDIIDATMELQEYKKEAYEEDLEYAETAKDVLATLNENMVTLSGTLQEMDEVDEFLSYKETTSSDEITATAGDGAKTGTHTIVIGQLARKDVWIAEDISFSSEDDIIASNATSITLSYAGESLSLDIAAGTTAEELVNMINSDSDFDDKISSSLIYDGSGYHLKLSGNDTGSSNVIEIVDFDLNGISSADFNNTQAACNAELKIDGYPSAEDSWLERDSNTVTDLIDGVTLELNHTTDSDGVEVGVTYDTDAMVSTIENFVSEINQMIYDIQNVTGRLDTDTDYSVSTDTDDEDSDDDDDSSFTLNDSSLDVVYNSIKNVLSTIGLGFERYDSTTEEGDLYTTLSTIGITTDSEQGSDTFGQLVIDYDDLEEAIAADPEAVATLFAASGEAESNTSSLEVISSVSGLTKAGEYSVEYEISGGEIISATIDGVEMKISGSTMLAQSNSDANGLYLNCVESDDGTYNATISVKQGKCGELADLFTSMTDVTSGSIPLLIKSYDESITNLENNIYTEEARLDSLETELNRKYAALDEMLSYYENIASQLEATLSSSS